MVSNGHGTWKGYRRKGHVHQHRRVAPTWLRQTLHYLLFLRCRLNKSHSFIVTREIFHTFPVMLRLAQLCLFSVRLYHLRHARWLDST